jgi:hypothetical protein
MQRAIDVATRAALLSGSVVLMIQGHDWDSELLSLMGLAGIVGYVWLTTTPGGTDHDH